MKNPLSEAARFLFVVGLLLYLAGCVFGTPDANARAALALASPAKTYRSIMADPPKGRPLFSCDGHCPCRACDDGCACEAYGSLTACGREGCKCAYGGWKAARKVGTDEIETFRGRVSELHVSGQALFFYLEVEAPKKYVRYFYAMKNVRYSINGVVNSPEALLADWYRNSTNAETAEIDTIPRRYGHVREVRISRPPLVGSAPPCTCRTCPDDGFRYVLDRDGSIAGRQCTCGCGRFHPGAGLPQIRRLP